MVVPGGNLVGCTVGHGHVDVALFGGGGCFLSCWWWLPSSPPSVVVVVDALVPSVMVVVGRACALLVLDCYSFGLKLEEKNWRAHHHPRAREA